MRCQIFPTRWTSLVIYNLTRKVIYASIKNLPFSLKEGFID